MLLVVTLKSYPWGRKLKKSESWKGEFIEGGPASRKERPVCWEEGVQGSPAVALVTCSAPGGVCNGANLGSRGQAGAAGV